MRATKQAVAAALADDPADLVPRAQVFSVERATLPTLPSIEVIGVTSERQDTGPLVRHELSIEVTVSNASEDGADEQLDAIVGAVRDRLAGAVHQDNPIVLEDGQVAAIELLGTRWSVSAEGSAGVIRGAAISVLVGVNDE